MILMTVMTPFNYIAGSMYLLHRHAEYYWSGPRNMSEGSITPYVELTTTSLIIICTFLNSVPWLDVRVL